MHQAPTTPVCAELIANLIAEVKALRTRVAALESI
jgi:hypothetical protein